MRDLSTQLKREQMVSPHPTCLLLWRAGFEGLRVMSCTNQSGCSVAVATTPRSDPTWGHTVCTGAIWLNLQPFHNACPQPLPALKFRTLPASLSQTCALSVPLRSEPLNLIWSNPSMPDSPIWSLGGFFLYSVWSNMCLIFCAHSG